MNIELGKKCLLTVDSWFYAPDGCQYRAVFGTVKAVRSSEEALGVRTNAKSSNWYVEIGCVPVAGCQIHYAVRCDVCNLGTAQDFVLTDKGLIQNERPTVIFNADAWSSK